MKTKFSKDALQSSLILSFFIFLFNLLFSALIMLVIWYWVFPKVCVIAPKFEHYLEFLDDAGMTKISNIIHLISTCLAMFPSAILAYRISKKRKKEFIKYSKARISYSDGLKYYISEYAFSDAVSMFALIVILTFGYMITGNSWIIRNIPMIFYPFSILGILIGFVLVIALTGISMLGGIFFAQRRWRAEHFFEE